MLKTKTLRYIKLPNFPKNKELIYGSADASGLDLIASINKTITLFPSQRELIPTGIAIELPFGYEGQIRPRSGLALKYGLTVLNSPATIDNDYRGEIQIIMINLSDTPFDINPEMRIAQLIISKIEQVHLHAVDDIFKTPRNIGGFGSTGLY